MSGSEIKAGGRYFQNLSYLYCGESEITSHTLTRDNGNLTAVIFITISFYSDLVLSRLKRFEFEMTITARHGRFIAW